MIEFGLKKLAISKYDMYLKLHCFGIVTRILLSMKVREHIFFQAQKPAFDGSIFISAQVRIDTVDRGRPAKEQ